MKFRFSTKNNILFESEGSNATWVEIAKVISGKGYKVFNPETGKIELNPSPITSKMLDDFISNFNDPTVTTNNVLDVHIGHPREEVEAVGWIKNLKREGDVLLAFIEFIDSFAQKIKEGAWKFCSIEAFDKDVHPDTAKPIGARLTGLGITNAPFVRGLAPISLSENLEAQDNVVYLIENGDSTQMLAELLKSILGLPEATEEDIAKMVEACDPASLKALLMPTEESTEASDKEKDKEKSKDASKEEATKALSDKITNLEMQLQAVSAILQTEKNDKLSLSERLAQIEDEKLEKELAEKEKCGVITASTKAHWKALAKSNPDMFEKLTSIEPKQKALFSQVTSNKINASATTSELSQFASEFSTRLKTGLKLRD